MMLYRLNFKDWDWDRKGTTTAEYKRSVNCGQRLLWSSLLASFKAQTVIAIEFWLFHRFSTLLLQKATTASHMSANTERYTLLKPQGTSVVCVKMLWYHNLWFSVGPMRLFQSIWVIIKENWHFLTACVVLCSSSHQGYWERKPACGHTKPKTLRVHIYPI